MERGQYWTREDRVMLPVADSFTRLAEIALGVLARMPQPIGQVCGPISSGGFNNLEQNLAAFDLTIDRLIQQRYIIFDQMPLEREIFRLLDEGKGTRNQNELLNSLYLPIFESGLVSTLLFISNWETSNGARWEHEQAERLGIQIVYLDPEPSS